MAVNAKLYGKTQNETLLPYLLHEFLHIFKFKKVLHENSRTKCFLLCSCGFLNILHFVIQSTLKQRSDMHSALLALRYVPQGTQAPLGSLKQFCFSILALALVEEGGISCVLH